MAKRKASEAYLAKLKDPRWQKKRLEVLERDEWACQMCFDTESTLHVHHRYYIPGREPWDISTAALVTLCESCHESETARRPEAEQELLRVLRLHFLTDEIQSLAHVFGAMIPLHGPDVIAAVIARTLLNEEVQRRAIEDYFDAIKASEEDDKDEGA